MMVWVFSGMLRLLTSLDVGRSEVWLGPQLIRTHHLFTAEEIGCRISVSEDGEVAVETPEERDRRWTAPAYFPHGGDAVRLAGPWESAMLPAGSIGIIDGATGRAFVDSVSITFRFSAFVTDGPLGEVASCSGGPGTIATPVTQLSLTPEIHSYEARMSRDCDSCGLACYYQRKARLWEWRPRN
jgi:hypothetical protein